MSQAATAVEGERVGGVATLRNGHSARPATYPAQVDPIVS
jgi:hypothetical protein